jgi:long-chain acyl-CoA synthetase
MRSHDGRIMEAAVKQKTGVYRHPADWALDFAPLSLTDMFERAVETAPDAPMLDFLGRKFTYIEMAHLVRRVATGLAVAGIRPGDRVGLYLPNVPQYVAAYFGALRLGAVLVNLSPLCSAEDLRHQVRDSGTRLLITVSSTSLLTQAVALLEGAGLERVVAGSLAGTLPARHALLYKLFRRDAMSALPTDDRVSTFQALIDNDGTMPKVGVDPEQDVALLQYSGGTTGRPKGAMLTHQALSANARQIVAVDPFSRALGGGGERTVGALPLFHIFGLSCVLNRTVADSGEMVLLPHFDPREVVAAVKRTQATNLPGVPTMYQALLDYPGLERTSLSSLRTCISGGAALPASLKQRFEERTGVLLVEGYGLTEGGILCSNPVAGDGKPGTVGQPLPASRVALVHRDDPARDPLPGEAGEIIVRGPQMMRGYWRDRDAPPFVEREGLRWLRTGDLGTIDAEGYVRIVDRLKDMISVGGIKVFPSQVEAILCRHPAVAEALVIGIPDERWGELPKAFVTLHSEAATTGDDLLAWLNPRLGRHERVTALEVRASLPRTEVGKLSRRALMAQEVACMPGGGPGAA